MSDNNLLYYRKYQKYYKRWSTLNRSVEIRYIQSGSGELENLLSKMSQDLFKIKASQIGIYPKANQFQGHFEAWKDILTHNYYCGILSTDKIRFPTHKLLSFLRENNLQLNQDLVLKFVCLEKCNKLVKSFYLVTRPAVDNIIKGIKPEIVQSNDSDLDEVYKFFANYKIVYWKDDTYTLDQSIGTDTIVQPIKIPTIDLDKLPIDIVYTWVNSNDIEWQRRLNSYLASEHFRLNKDVYNHEFLDKIRYRDRDELRYSLRSVEQYCPWVRHVYLVTDGQLPNWINLDHTKLKHIRHNQIMPMNSLPTFNSLAIEANLHKIKGLSDYFIYFNDDFFVNQPLEKSAFINSSGKIKVYLDTTPSTVRCNYLRQSIEQHNLLDSGQATESYKEIEEFIENCYKLYKISPKGLATMNELGHYSQWKNTNSILDSVFVKEDRKFLAHSPYIQHKPTIQALQAKMSNQFDNTSRSRFRSIKCIGSTNALNPYYSYYIGMADMLDSHQDSHTIHLHNNEVLNDIQFRSITKFKPLFFVIQDSNHLNSVHGFKKNINIF